VRGEKGTKTIHTRKKDEHTSVEPWENTQGGGEEGGAGDSKEKKERFDTRSAVKPTLEE